MSFGCNMFTILFHCPVFGIYEYNWDVGGLLFHCRVYAISIHNVLDHILLYTSNPMNGCYYFQHAPLPFFLVGTEMPSNDGLYYCRNYLSLQFPDGEMTPFHSYLPYQNPIIFRMEVGVSAYSIITTDQSNDDDDEDENYPYRYPFTTMAMLRRVRVHIGPTSSSPVQHPSVAMTTTILLQQAP
jgi:hypothetical protein